MRDEQTVDAPRRGICGFVFGATASGWTTNEYDTRSMSSTCDSTRDPALERAHAVDNNVANVILARHGFTGRMRREITSLIAYTCSFHVCSHVRRLSHTGFHWCAPCPREEKGKNLSMDTDKYLMQPGRAVYTTILHMSTFFSSSFVFQKTFSP